ncbi:amidohydrolase [Arthrobacter sp. efr-133-TYG-118]|uniref:amidohydrolase n=1 Tax=Arthrobacter sp. efr-133-TYG-118 TaxID=3040279 RepID=UPI00254D693D|nr:amidohydrolase [Arthrobacter sp. efr-133-TYG-118]
MASAETIFENGWIYTGEDERPVRTNVAVADGRVLALGDGAEVSVLATGATRRVDLNGRLLIPGFQDGHIHPIMAGVEHLQCDLTETTTAEEAVSVVRRYAESHPDEPWILGAGWSMDCFPGGTPTRQMLDAVVSDRPVFVHNRDHHGAWANTKAFELAGIGAGTPDPDSGRIEREADGYPAGTVHEGAMGLFDHVHPGTSPEQAYEGLLWAQELMLSYGITAWQDALVGISPSGSGDTLETYIKAFDAGDLKVRVRAAQWWDRSAGRGQLDEILARRDRVAGACDPLRLSAATVKVMVDGVAENYTAAMHAPYRDSHGHHTDNHGIEFFDPAELREFVTDLDANGIQVHFHALGDRAVTDALDAVEQARSTNGPSDNRHHLAHLQLVRAADVPRFAALGATANLQALWACHEDQLDELTLPFLEADAEERHYPFGELAATGAHLAAGSDWAVSSPNPVLAIHVAVNRVEPGGALPPLGPEQHKLTLKQILDAYTQGTAWINHLDTDTGIIRPGALADLAILDRNLFDIPVEELHTARVDETWIAGERVFARADS